MRERKFSFQQFDDVWEFWQIFLSVSAILCKHLSIYRTDINSSCSYYYSTPTTNSHIKRDHHSLFLSLSLFLFFSFSLFLTLKEIIPLSSSLSLSLSLATAQQNNTYSHNLILSRYLLSHHSHNNTLTHTQTLAVVAVVAVVVIVVVWKNCIHRRVRLKSLLIGQ